LAEKLGSVYPVSQQFTVLEGYDIYRSDCLIVALVVVEEARRRDLRLYRWQNKKGVWKVDLCRMSAANWKWREIAQKAEDLMAKYQIGREKATSKL
jgi:hypothetical protein